MPLYEYQCKSCGDVSEVIQRISEPPLTTCEACGGELKKLVSAPAFQFKGSGWYVTDYAGKGSANGKDDSEGKESKAKDGDSKSDSGGDAKSEKKASKTSEAKPEAMTKSERIAAG